MYVTIVANPGINLKQSSRARFWLTPESGEEFEVYRLCSLLLVFPSYVIERGANQGAALYQDHVDSREPLNILRRLIGQVYERFAWSLNCYFRIKCRLRTI